MTPLEITLPPLTAMAFFLGFIAERNRSLHALISSFQHTALEMPFTLATKIYERHYYCELALYYTHHV